MTIRRAKKPFIPSLIIHSHRNFETVRSPPPPPPPPPPGTNPTGNTQQVCQLSPVINANCSLYSIWLFDFISLILLELELATRLPRAGRARANVK